MTTFIIDPPKPHGRKQALIMQAFLHPGLEEIWVANGTKWGKSISAATGLVTAAISKPNSIMRWVAPIYSQSKIGMSYCRKILPPEPYVNINLSGMEAKITGNHSRIQFYHAQNPVSLEGYGISLGERVPIVSPANGENAEYLETKRTKLGHLRAV